MTICGYSLVDGIGVAEGIRQLITNQEEIFNLPFFATAQLLLVMLDRARAQGMTRVRDLLRLERGQRWLAR